MIDFSKVKEITIPEGKVSKIEIDNNIVWTAANRYIAKVNCLKSNGSQYIDTGVAGNNDNLRIELEFGVLAFKAYGGILGNYVSENHNSWRIIFQNADNNGTYINTNNLTSKASSPTINKTSTAVSLTKNKIIINGKTTTPYTNQGSENENNILIFKASHNAAIGTSIKVSYLKIYDGDELIRDYIPVIALLNGNTVACFYDKVDKKLYYNNGTGEFDYD